MNVTDPAVAMYVAAAVALVVWLGIFAYLWRIDVQARALRRALDEGQRSQPAPEPTLIRPERQRPTARIDEAKEVEHGRG